MLDWHLIKTDFPDSFVYMCVAFCIMSCSCERSIDKYVLCLLLLICLAPPHI